MSFWGVCLEEGRFTDTCLNTMLCSTETYHIYFTIYTYLHQLFAMFSGRLQHSPEFKFKCPASTTHRLPPLKYKPRFQVFFRAAMLCLQQNGPDFIQLFWSLNDF
jgi:hypothetical protein